MRTGLAAAAVTTTALVMIFMPGRSHAQPAPAPAEAASLRAFQLQRAAEAITARREAAAAMLTQGAVNAVAGLRWQAAHPPPPPPVPPAPVAAATMTPGVLSFAAIEQLWVSAGGPAWAEWAAATIAECESGGNPRAWNPSGAAGIWQILGQVVPGWIFDPFVNALNAVAKFTASGDTWSQWVCQA